MRKRRERRRKRRAKRQKRVERRSNVRAHRSRYVVFASAWPLSGARARSQAAGP